MVIGDRKNGWITNLNSGEPRKEVLCPPLETIVTWSAVHLLPGGLPLVVTKFGIEATYGVGSLRR